MGCACCATRSGSSRPTARRPVHADYRPAAGAAARLKPVDDFSEEDFIRDLKDELKAIVARDPATGQLGVAVASALAAALALHPTAIAAGLGDGDRALASELFHKYRAAAAVL